MRLSRRTALTVFAAGLVSVGCGETPVPLRDGSASLLRLGFLANLTHLTPLAAVARGFYTGRLGATRLRTQVFRAGTAAVEALFGDSLDAVYLGPGPAVTAWVRSQGEAVRLVAGATVGGASLVVRRDVATARDLAGTRLATPQLGNTQDLALRSWLVERGLEPGVDVSVVPTANATTLSLFEQGGLDGGWLPEPWPSRMVVEAGARVLVDERDLWPDGRFVTTCLVVSAKFLSRFPKTVSALLAGQVDTNDWVAANPVEAKSTVNAALAELAGGALHRDVLERAWSQLSVSNELAVSSVELLAERAVRAGLFERADLHGFYEAGPLEDVLAGRS